MNELRSPLAEGADLGRPTVSIVVIGWGRAQHLLGCLNSIALVGDSVSYEVIVTLNEPTSDLLADLSAGEVEVQVVSSRVNRGFGGACNAAVDQALGDYILFLNDDTLVDRSWLQELVDTAEAHPNAGAVGSLCLNMDGSIQEAGNFLWSDGTTSSSTDELNGLAHRYDFARKVDYCSAASLLVRRSTWDAVGGYDETYYPAYYEDLDLCLKIREVGQEVWFQPASTVRHIRSASTSRPYREFLMHRHRPMFQERWWHVTAEQQSRTDDPVADEELATWVGMGRPQRILVIDDRIPDSSLGSGFGRMFDALTELLATDEYFISFFPSAVADGDRYELGRRGLRILGGDLADHLAQAATTYDLVVISRPHNYEKYGAMVREKQPGAAVIYDAEALYFRRTELQAVLAVDELTQGELQSEAAAMRLAEAGYFADADHVVCISDAEAAFARTIAGTGGIHVVQAHLRGPTHTLPPFERRRDLIFVSSWLPGPESPNGDGLTWFVTKVLPLIRESIPWIRLRVTGANPPPEMLRFESPNVRFEGRVNDLADFYARARVAIAPIRYGAGVKLKTMEALQFGTPTVATTVGAEGIDTYDTGALLIADDPSGFAQAVVALVDDPHRWHVQRRAITELHRRWADAGSGTSWRNVVGVALQDRVRQPPEPVGTDS